MTTTTQPEDKVRGGMKNIIVTVEPSRRLSELCGFPYYIEKRIPLSTLIKQGVVTDIDLKEMEQGKQLHKSIPIVR